MANRRELVKRRKAVRNIKKITRTMQLIATAKFQASHTRALESKPYSEKLAELAADLTRAGATADHPLMRAPEGTENSALLVLTSDRGQCGGYNANVLRSAVGYLKEREAAGEPTDVHMVGKRGNSYFRFLGREVAAQTTGMSDGVRYDQVEGIAQELMDRFIAGEIASAHVAYMRFYSAGKQRPELLRLLPLSRQEPENGEQPEGGGRVVEYEFSPSPQELLDELLPASVKMRLYQCFMDAEVSEHVARMVAMKAATDAATEMIKTLTREYNRARQTAITMELLDIIGGANALA